MREAHRLESVEISEVTIPGTVASVDNGFGINAIALSSQYNLEVSEIIPAIQAVDIHKNHVVRNIGYKSMTLAQRKSLGHIQRSRRK